MTPATLPPVAIAVPYPEGAIIEYARWLESRGNLGSLWLPSRALTAGALALLPHKTNDKYRSRILKGVDQVDRVRTVAPLLEVLRLISREPRLRSVAPHTMDAYKRLFDYSVSRHLADSSVVMAMPGAAERTFRRASGVKVLHAVDGHPRAVNALLKSTFGKTAEREIVPERRVMQIERELAAADVVLVPSELKKRQYRTCGVAEERLSLAPYGVDTSRFFALPPGGRQRRKPKILFVGQISYRKGVPLLADAARGVDVDVEMVGPVVEPELLRGLPDNVVYRRTVSSNELNAFMNQSDALVLPSLEDAFGLVVLEALASGLPVLTTDETGAAEAVSAHDGWIVPAGEMLPLRSALRAVPLLSDEERGARARRLRGASDDRTWERYGTVVDQAVAAGLEKSRR